MFLPRLAQKHVFAMVTGLASLCTIFGILLPGYEDSHARSWRWGFWKVRRVLFRHFSLLVSVLIMQL